MNNWKVLILSASFAFIIIASCINEQKTPVTPAQLPYKNLHDSVNYVGRKACKQCHSQIYSDFIHTQMGQSFKKAVEHHSQADFTSRHIIYDSINQLYYQPFKKDTLLFIKEFRLNNKHDTTHLLIEKIDYIIGSGHHTNSHIISKNGYLYQAPLTFYTQKQIWDLPPGFETQNNRFRRIISDECMSCHNGISEFVPKSLNKFNSLADGIGCERCHGPGEVHIKEKQAGNVVDVSQKIDYSIVNPAKLPWQYQLDVCQRCHHQAVSVLHEGKDYYDFRPGMRLSEVMEIFQQRFSDSASVFIMASQYDRMTMSKCFKKSNGQLTCITCHNPHKNIHSFNDDFFNRKCISCHSDSKEVSCSENEKVLKINHFNCISCHMKKASSYDIPHVVITDHYITKHPESRAVELSENPVSELERQKYFIQLVCATNSAPDDLSKAKAYLNYFEKFAADNRHLDSAKKYLVKARQIADKSVVNKYFIRYYYLKQEYDSIIALVSRTRITSDDDWLLYRIGEAYFHRQQLDEALRYFQLACEAAPYNLDFKSKYASALLMRGDFEKAKQIFEEILQQNSSLPEVNNNLGYCIMLMAAEQGRKDEMKSAEQYFLRALHYQPDYTKAMENLVTFYLNISQMEKAKIYLQKLLKQHPYHPKYIALQKQIMRKTKR